ncbi:hypothetical protein [Catenulispora pinisilvae]|uniref:hypothetical protein n=1 Tax=Catenulispora pinisilvae TaxID=2705253 RepID=UPI001891E8A9|nr:hypothetical protein [Catenulispora pinisilvae]
MKKQWETFWGFVILGGLVALIASFAHVHVPGRTVLDVGLGAVSLYWLLIITTVPWNLYFRALRVRNEIGVSRERGITVPEGRAAEVRRWERVLLRLALAGHVVTAAVVAGVTYASGHVLGYYFAAFYLLSCAIRPMAAYLGYVKAQIAGLLKETTHPRDDVLELSTGVSTLTAEVEALRGATSEAQERAFRELDDVRGRPAGRGRAAAGGRAPGPRGRGRRPGRAAGPGRGGRAARRGDHPALRPGRRRPHRPARTAQRTPGLRPAGAGGRGGDRRVGTRTEPRTEQGSQNGAAALPGLRFGRTPPIA